MTTSAALQEVGLGLCGAAEWVEMMGELPLRDRASAEAWRVERHEVARCDLIAEHPGRALHKCKWRGLDCISRAIESGSLDQDADALPSGDQSSARRRSHDEREEMLREIATASRVRHPKVLQFLGACLPSPEDADQSIAILWEHLGYGTLAQKLARERLASNNARWRSERDQCLDWMQGIMSAIFYVHETPPSCTGIYTLGTS